MNKSHSNRLALLFDIELRAAILPAKEEGGLLWGARRFIDQGHGGFMGFHDWFRKRSFPKHIVGVRFWAHEADYIPTPLIKSRIYITLLTEKNAFALWFGMERDYENSLSGDQSFGLNPILVSLDNSLTVLVLDTNSLSPDEIQNLESRFKFEVAAWI